MNLEARVPNLDEYDQSDLRGCGCVGALCGPPGEGFYRTENMENMCKLFFSAIHRKAFLRMQSA